MLLCLQASRVSWDCSHCGFQEYRCLAGDLGLSTLPCMRGAEFQSTSRTMPLSTSMCTLVPWPHQSPGNEHAAVHQGCRVAPLPCDLNTLIYAMYPKSQRYLGMEHDPVGEETQAARCSVAIIHHTFGSASQKGAVRARRGIIPPSCSTLGRPQLWTGTILRPQDTEISIRGLGDGQHWSRGQVGRG